jgi:hypothetical protein
VDPHRKEEGFIYSLKVGGILCLNTHSPDLMELGITLTLNKEVLKHKISPPICILVKGFYIILYYIISYHIGGVGGLEIVYKRI